MTFLLVILRKKILRKLGKTFSKKYNFKRLLQTAPDLVRLYNKQEGTINSVNPVRFIQLKEELGPIAGCNPMASPKDAVSFDVFGPAPDAAWPYRIKYAEQIHELNEHGFGCVWTVRLIENSGQETRWSDRVKAKVKQVPNPTIIAFWMEAMLGNLIPPTNAHVQVNPQHLPSIDEKHDSAFFLSDGREEETVQELTHCGIIPHERHLWNATFYDYQVAHLYAESVEHQLRQDLRI